MTAAAERYVTFNKMTRRYQPISRAEMVPGLTVIRLYFAKTAGAWVTVPGASLYTVTAAGDLALSA